MRIVIGVLPLLAIAGIVILLLAFGWEDAEEPPAAPESCEPAPGAAAPTCAPGVRPPAPRLAGAGHVPAEARVRSLDTLLDLSPSQEESLTSLWSDWLRQDAGRRAPRATWLSRESDFKSRLTPEQADLLHVRMVTRTRQSWSSIGGLVAGLVGASPHQQAQFPQSLGEPSIPAVLLLPEAHDADGPGLLRQAGARLDRLLSPQQKSRLDQAVGD